MAPLSCGERSWGSVPVRGSLPPTPPAAPTGARRGRAGRAGGAAGTVRHRPAGGRDGPMGRGRGEVQRPRSTQEGRRGWGRAWARVGAAQGASRVTQRRQPPGDVHPSHGRGPAPACSQQPRRPRGLRGDRETEGPPGGWGSLGAGHSRVPRSPALMDEWRGGGGGRGSHRARQPRARAGTRAHAAHGSPSRWHKRPEQPGCAAQRLPPPS